MANPSTKRRFGADRAATAEAVVGQVAAGIDIGNDGEQARESFFTYVQHRMTGFGGTSRRPMMRDLAGIPTSSSWRGPAFERTR